MKLNTKTFLINLIILSFISILIFVIYLENAIHLTMNKEIQTHLFHEISSVDNLPKSYYEVMNKYYPNHFKQGVWQSITSQIFGYPRNKCQCREIYLSWHSKKMFSAEIIALELEDRFSQKQCYEYNMSIINFGYAQTGIKNAAKYYYNKSIEELNAKEIISLNLMANHSTLYNPKRNQGLLDAKVEEILNQ